jgi:hypothetical protein
MLEEYQAYIFLLSGEVHRCTGCEVAREKRLLADLSSFWGCRKVAQRAALTRSRVAMGAEVGSSAVLVAICVLVAALGSAATGYLFHSRMTGLPLRQLLSTYTVECTGPPLCYGMTDIDDQPRDVDHGAMSSVPGHRGIPAQRPVSQGQSRRRWGIPSLLGRT